MVGTSELDSEVQVLLEMMDQNDAPPVHALTPEGAREQFGQLIEQAPAEDVASMQDITVEGPGGSRPRTCGSNQ